MSERRRSHSHWDVAEVSSGKNFFAKQKKKWGIPDNWGVLALHHQISKATLESLGTNVFAILGDKKATPELKKAAQSFWDAVQAAVPAEIKQQAHGDLITILWNMPLNLEIGPELVSNNPLIGFDPNTVPLPDGSRKLASVSVYLQQLERTYLKAIRSGGLTDKDLSNMTGQLGQAYKNFLAQVRETGTLLLPPSVEQWVYDPQGDDETKEKFQRKGLKMFLGAKEGGEQFGKARLLGLSSADIIKYANQQGVLAASETTSTLHVEEESIPIKIEVVFLQSALYHICVRHTYIYFSPDQAKVVNSFWPNPNMSESDVKGWVVKVLPYIGKAGAEYLQSLASIGEDLTALDTHLRGQNIRIGDSEELFYFIASLEIDEVGIDGTTPEKFKMTVKTATQDAQAHAYTRNELQLMFG